MNIKAIWQSIVSDLRYLWLKDHLVLILGVVLLVLVKGSQILISLLEFKTKAEVKSAQKQDAKLRIQEDKDLSEANLLEAEADNLPGQEKPVTAMWDKK